MIKFENNYSNFWVSEILDIDGFFDIFRVVTRDIGGTDPERMAAPRVVEYLQETFKDTVIKVRNI